MKLTPYDTRPITPRRIPGRMAMPERYTLCASPGLKWYWRRADVDGVTVERGPMHPRAESVARDAWAHHAKLSKGETTP